MAPRYMSSMRRAPILLISTLSFLSLFGSATPVPSEACLSDNPPAHIPWEPVADEIRTFSIGGRDVNIYIPSNYTKGSADKPAPMIFAFHDRDMPHEQLIELTMLHNPKVNPDAVVVMPIAGKGTWRSDIRPLKVSQSRPPPAGIDDIDFTVALVEDLQRVLCIDLSRIHAAGLGTGGGMAHLLACNKDASTRFASFVSVAGGYGRDDDAAGNGTWASCTPGRKPIPMMSVHGTEDRVQPYYLLNWEDSRKRLPVPAWLDRWSEMNGCGEETLDDIQSETEKRTTYTRLEGGGVMSKGDQYGTGVVRTAKACPVVEDDEGKEITDPKPLDLTDPEDSDVSVMHYKLPGVNHVWPRQQFPRLPELEDDEEAAESSQGKMEIKLNEKGEPVLQTAMVANTQKLMFDTTVLMLDWFRTHPLPTYWAEKWKKHDGDINTQREEMQKAMKKNEGIKAKENEKMLEHLDKRVKEGKMTEEQAAILRAKIRGPGGEDSELAGYGAEVEDDDMEIVMDDKDAEEKLRELEGGTAEVAEGEQEELQAGHDEL